MKTSNFKLETSGKLQLRVCSHRPEEADSCSQMISASSRRRLHAFSRFLAFALLIAAAQITSAQNILLSNAVVHTISGETIVGGEVFVADGKISAVGTNLTAPGVTALDLAGQHVYPGMIALDTILGLTEIGSIRASQDSTEVGEYTPDVQSWIAVNPDSELIPVTRANGVAFFEPVPEG